MVLIVNSSPLDKNGRFIADDIFRCIFVNEKFFILIKITLKFVPKGPVDNNPAVVQIMAWRRIGDKPLSEPMLTLHEVIVDDRMRYMYNGIFIISKRILKQIMQLA